MQDVLIPFSYVESRSESESPFDVVSPVTRGAIPAITPRQVTSEELTMRRLILLAAALLAVVLIVPSCSKSTKPAYGTVRVSLTDAPADYEAVILVIREVAVHMAGPDSSGWTSFVPDSASYDLLTLRNGVFAGLGEVLAPAGHYTQVRLILGPGSYVIENGVRRDLVVPSGLQTGLKLIGEFDVPAGGVVDLGIDFDAMRSIHETGTGTLVLQPTAKVQVIQSTGSIAGTVQPADPPSTVFAIAGAETLGTTIPGTDGNFLIPILPPGSYTVAIDAPAAYRDTSLANVGVTAGQVTQVGVVQLTPVSGSTTAWTAK